MAHRIHIFGASGSGTTTLGQELALRIDGRHLDTDAYYWQPTDPPFTTKRAPDDRIKKIQQDFEGVENWVLSGSICSWGDPLLEHFTLAVFLQLDSTVRMVRILSREQRRHGERIHPDGDMHQQHVDFMEWARSYDHAMAPVRSLDLHEQWMPNLKCPILKLNSDLPVNELCNAVLNRAGL